MDGDGYLTQSEFIGVSCFLSEVFHSLFLKMMLFKLYNILFLKGCVQDRDLLSDLSKINLDSMHMFEGPENAQKSKNNCKMTCCWPKPWGINKDKRNLNWSLILRNKKCFIFYRQFFKKGKFWTKHNVDIIVSTSKIIFYCEVYDCYLEEMAGAWQLTFNQNLIFFNFKNKEDDKLELIIKYLSTSEAVKGSMPSLQALLFLSPPLFVLIASWCSTNMVYLFSTCHCILYQAVTRELIICQHNEID